MCRCCNEKELAQHISSVGAWLGAVSKREKELKAKTKREIAFPLGVPTYRNRRRSHTHTNKKMPLLDVRHLGCHPDPEHNALLHSYVGVARAGLGGVTPAERQRTENLCVYFLAIQPRRPADAHSSSFKQQKQQKQENLFLYRSSQPNANASDRASNATIDHQTTQSVGGHDPPRYSVGGSSRRDGYTSQEDHEEELQAIRWYQRVRTVQVEDSWLLQADGSFATSLPVLPGPSSTSAHVSVPLDALNRSTHSNSSSPTVATVWSLFECFDNHRLSLSQFFQRIDTVPLMFRHLNNAPQPTVGGGRVDGTKVATAASPQAATSTTAPLQATPRLFAASVVPFTEAVHIVAPWVLLKPIRNNQGPSSSSTLPAEPHHGPTNLPPLADGAAVGLIPLGRNDPLLQYSLAWLVQTQPQIHKEYLALRQQLERFHSTLHREVEQQQKKLQSQRAAYEAQLDEMNRMVDELQESLLKKEQQKSSRLRAEDAWLHSHASPVRTHHHHQQQPPLEVDENDGDDDVEMEDDDDNDGMREERGGGTHDFMLDSYQPFERRVGGGKRILSHHHHHHHHPPERVRDVG